MRASRTLDRSSKKSAVKEARLKMKELSTTIRDFEKSCVDCSSGFDPTDKSLLDQWMVQVFDGRAFLYCPSCFATKKSAEANK